MSRILFPLLAVGSLCLLLPAAEPAAGTVRIEADLALEPNGDLRGTVTLDFALREYARIKAEVGDPRRLLRRLRGARADFLEAPDAAARFVDDRSAAVLDLHELGAAQSTGGGEWRLTVPGTSELVTTKENQGGIVAFFFETAAEVERRPCHGPVRVALPPNAADVRWDEAARTLRYSLPSGPVGGKLHVDVRSRDRSMSAIYKVYAQPAAFPEMWIARAVLRNEGAGSVRVDGVRFSIDGYADWTTAAEGREIAPGGTLVVPYYPVLLASIAHNRSNTPTQLRAEWTWTEAGAERKGSENRQVTFFGGEAYIGSTWSEGEALGTFADDRNGADFIAAWVTRDDPVVKEFAGMASRLAGGAGAQVSDEQAMEVVRACYELMLINRFSYKSPPYVIDPKMTFDWKLVQDVKFPRDVIRDKSGTCIDLAILQASMYYALGLKPYLAFISGHVFPVVGFESGTMISVEATGIEGGVQKGTLGFEEAMKMAKGEFEESRKKGELVLVDVQAAWNRGIANPELESLPADVLKKWGISEKGTTGGIMPEGVAQRHEDRSGFSGTWTGQVEHPVGPDGKTAQCPIELVIEVAEDGSARLFAVISAEARDGADTVQVRMEEEAIGENQEGQLVFQGMSKKAVRLDTGEEGEIPPGRGAAEIKDGKLVGTYGDDEHGFHEFTLEKKK